MKAYQNPDSGYLNSIGRGDTYLRKQMERILNNNIMKCNIQAEGKILAYMMDIK